jgi:hypothetical protein
MNEAEKEIKHAYCDGKELKKERKYVSDTSLRREPLSTAPENA